MGYSVIICICTHYLRLKPCLTYLYSQIFVNSFLWKCSASFLLFFEMFIHNCHMQSLYRRIAPNCNWSLLFLSLSYCILPCLSEPPFYSKLLQKHFWVFCVWLMSLSIIMPYLYLSCYNFVPFSLKTCNAI